MQWNKFNARESLEALIRGKESKDEVLDGSKKGVASVATLRFYIPPNEFTKNNPGFLGEQILEVHADTGIQSILQFIQNATDQTICISKGPKGGIRLGLAGNPVDKLHLFRPKSRKR